MSKHYQPPGKVRWQDHVLGGRTKSKSSRVVGAPAVRGPGKPKHRHGKARPESADAERVGGGHGVAHPIRRRGEDRAAHQRSDGKRPPLAKPPRPSREASKPDTSKPGISGPQETTPRVPRLDGQGLPFITLAQYLKRENAAGSGGEAKAVIRGGTVQVNGENELRPGRKLHHGDTVLIAGAQHRVELPTAPGSDTPAG